MLDISLYRALLGMYGVWRKAGNSLWTHRYGDRTYCCIFKEFRPLRAHEQLVGCCYDVGALFVFLRLSVDTRDLLLSCRRNVPISLGRCDCRCIQSFRCSTGFSHSNFVQKKLNSYSLQYLLSRNFYHFQRNFVCNDKIMQFPVPWYILDCFL